MSTNRSGDNRTNTLEGRSVLSLHMTHTLLINGTQKKEHILMVKKKIIQLRGVYIVGVCTTGRRKAQTSFARAECLRLNAYKAAIQTKEPSKSN